MNSIKASLIGMTVGGIVVFKNYEKIEDMLKVSKRKIKSIKRKTNCSMI